jgi:hypothetical protein
LSTVTKQPIATLGDLLYRDPDKRPVAEAAWLAKLQAIADGDARALRALFDRAHRLVFTLAMRITKDGPVAETVTVDVFHEIWLRAYRYDPSRETVIGWIMNLTRSVATGWKRVAGDPVSDENDPAVELKPSASLFSRLANRIGREGWAAVDAQPFVSQWPELGWDQPASGIHCKILSTDSDRNRVTMLVRLEPGIEYPPHTHAGTEELHLLNGELWIDDRKVPPGGYYRAEPGTSDERVWSQTGCSCVLITSPEDTLR